MGLLPCPLLSRQPNDQDSDNTSQAHLHSYSSTSSLSSVPSLSSSSSSSSSATHHRLLSTLKGHSSPVFSLALAPKHLFSGSSNSEIRSWSRDPSSPDNTILIPSSRSAVKSIVLSGDTLFTAHQDHKIRVWKTDPNNTKNYHYRCVNTLPTAGDRLTRCLWAKNYVEVRRHKKCTWVHHVDAVSALALSRDGSLLCSVSWDRTFKVWRTSDYKCLESVWNAHDDAINAVVLSSDGFVYTGSADTKIKVWRRHDGEKKHRLVDTLEKHKSAVNALALSTDGSVLYSGACDRSIIVWEKDSCGGGGDGGKHMVVVGGLKGHRKAILCLVVVADLVCSGSADKTVRIWRRGSSGKEYSCLSVLEGHNGPVKCLAAAVDSCGGGGGGGDSNSGCGTSYKIYSGSLDCDIKVWQMWVPFLE